MLKKSKPTLLLLYISLILTPLTAKDHPAPQILKDSKEKDIILKRSESLNKFLRQYPSPPAKISSHK